MVGEIRRGKLYADREEASGENDAHDFKSDDTAMIAPCAGIEHVCAVWAHDDAHRGPEHDFVHIELTAGAVSRLPLLGGGAGPEHAPFA